MLENGRTLPSIGAKDLEGDDVFVADLIGGPWSVVLFYRGHW